MHVRIYPAVRPYLSGCKSVSVRLQVRICPVARPYLSGCTSVSTRLQVRICPVAGPYLRGCRSVSARLQECICPDVRHRLSPYELLERLYLVVQYQFLRKSCLLQ